MEVGRSECRVKGDRMLKRFQGSRWRAEPRVETRLRKVVPCHWIVGVQAGGLLQGGECSVGLRPVCMIEGVAGRGPKRVGGDQQAVTWGETVIVPSGLEPQRVRILQLP